MFKRLNILFILILPIYLYATPNWFYNIPSKSYEIVGYGVDENLQIARDIAKAEISKTIKINISSNTNLNKSIIDGNYNKTHLSKISTSTNATLQGIKIVKEEFIDDKWFVLAIYDNRTLIQKINIKHPKFKESNLKDIQNLKMIRKDNSWYLKIKNDLYLLNNQNFQQIFSNIEHKDLIFQSNKSIYKSQEQMQFKITAPNKGYVSILYSESNGKVGVVLANKNINKELIYPKQNDENQLIAYNPTKNTIVELYIAVYSKDKLDLQEFENISENILDESNYNFDKLLDIIKNNKFSSIKLKIRK
ncbi:MAG: LPP20 family lipoprotein [Campylobacterota bacterium]|nr:LPP20 family lipoprotein [Campylobacterota bacterium]